MSPKVKLLKGKALNNTWPMTRTENQIIFSDLIVTPGQLSLQTFKTFIKIDQKTYFSLTSSHQATAYKLPGGRFLLSGHS